MAHEVLNRARFIAKSGDEEYHITLELIPSGGFSYGNGHALLYNAHDGSGEHYFDARYDKRFSSGAAFIKNALGFVKDQLRDDFTVEPEDDFFNLFS